MSAVPALGRPRTKAETARFFGVSEKTIQRRVAHGELECVRSGKVLRFLDEHIEAFLERNTTGVTVAAAKPPRNPKYAARAA